MKKTLTVALATSGLLASALLGGVATAGNVNAASVTSSVIGERDGTTLGTAAQHFAEIRKTGASPAANASAGSAEPAVKDHPSWGVFSSNLAITGQQAYQSVSPNFSFGSDTVYAPTMKSPGSCIEIVTAYNQGTAPEVWAWDWCNTVDVAKSVGIDASFIANYTVKKNGADSYQAKLEQTNSSSNTWSAQLFNVKTQKWDTLYTQKGTDKSASTRSWNVFEVYADGPQDSDADYCDAMGSKVFQSTGYQIKTNGGWSAATSANTQVLKTGNASFRCDLSQTVLHPNDAWAVQKNLG